MLMLSVYDTFRTNRKHIANENLARTWEIEYIDNKKQLNICFMANARYMR